METAEATRHASSAASGFPARSRWSAGGRNSYVPRCGRALGNTDLERAGCLLHCEEGEEIGLECCVVWSRISPEVRVADFAWVSRGKGERERAFRLSCFACFRPESVGLRKPADRVW